jgi:hypothetical protein
MSSRKLIPWLTLALVAALGTAASCTGRPFAFGPRIGEPVDGGVLLPDGRFVESDMGAVIPCIDSTDCGSVGFCGSNGVCTQAGNEPCNGIEDCSLGQYCVMNSCTYPSIGAACGLASDCGLGEDCQNGQCVSPDGPCIDDSDCPVGSACDAFTVSCATINPSCLQDSDCPDGYGCGGSGCVPTERQLCTENVDCASGSCVGGYCDGAGNDPDPMPQG